MRAIACGVFWGALVALTAAGAAGAPSFSPAGQPPWELHDPGHYIKDYTIIYANGRIHCFYIRGKAGPKQSWEDLPNETDFGHASTADLVHWTIHEPVLPTRPGTWEERNVWAPHAFRFGGLCWMMYTGVNDHIAQRLGLAQSSDMFNWRRFEGNPVITPGSWADWGEDRWGDGRDPCVWVEGGVAYCYYSAKLRKEGEPVGVIACAVSTDLRRWVDVGPVLQTKYIPESAQVFRNGGKYYMLTSARGHGSFESDHPIYGWGPSDFRPPPGAWAQEVFRVGDRWFISGFVWRAPGSFVRIWPLEWKDGVPRVVLGSTDRQP